jgi:hypothetical protein
MNWEAEKKSHIKEMFDKKFNKIDTPKKNKLISQTSVLFDDTFYLNTCQGDLLFIFHDRIKTFFYFNLIINFTH